MGSKYDPHLDKTIRCLQCGYVHSPIHRTNVQINDTLSESQCPKCGGPSYVDVVTDLEVRNESLLKRITELEKEQTDLRRQLAECKAKSRHGLNQSDKFGL